MRPKKIDQEPGRGKILDAWDAPDQAGEPVGCIVTSYTFDSIFFETECLARFLALESDAEDDRLQFAIEQEARMAPLITAAALVDSRYCVAKKRSLRWDLLPARLSRRRMHAKVCVLAWEKWVRVVVASANLTPDGYRRNQEVFGVLDYHEAAEAPAGALRQIVRFLQRLVSAAVLDGEGSPSIKRWNEFLNWVNQHATNWGVDAERARKLPIAVFPVLSGLQQSDVLTQLRQLWPASAGPPYSAWIVSPFFDPGQTGDQATKALWEILRQRGETNVNFCLSSEDVPGGDRTLMCAPPSLLASQPRRASAWTAFHRITDTNNRPLHMKSIWLEGDRYALYLIGSSNFTANGLNLSGTGNVEANLAYLVDEYQHPQGFRELEACFPRYQTVEADNIQWLEKLEEDEELVAEDLPLPSAFGRATHDASFEPHGRLWLRFLAVPEPGWQLLSEQDLVVLTDTDWERRGRPPTVELLWTADCPPSGLLIRWGDTGRRAWWPVEVDSRDNLPPPEELRALPLETLIRILTSPRPLHAAVAQEERRRQEPGSALLTPAVDPHQKVQVSTFLLQRSRRVARAMQALCGRLAEPTPSEACLHWRLRGPVGVKALAAALERESKSEEEKAFLLTELALDLARLQPKSSPGAISPGIVRVRLRECIAEIRELIPTNELLRVANLKQYVERAFSEISE